MTLDAMDAGKDVYVEKPLCHTPEEGKELVEAERDSDRIVQVGMQRRSYNLYLEARDMRRGGRLGTVRMVRTYWLNSRTEPSRQAFRGPIDWKQWLGPAPDAPEDPLTFFNWRSLAAYSGGIAQDQGCHIFDSIHLIMDAGYPVSVNATALRPHVEGMDLPESVVVAAEYPQGFLAIFTINYNAMRYAMRARDPTDAKTKETTQHGANRLAAIGLSVLTVVPKPRRGQVRLAMLGGPPENDGMFVIRWPIWRAPISLACIRALLGHPGLENRETLAALGIAEIRQARRISSGKFMNFTRAAPETVS